MGIDYKSAGVDIKAGDSLVNWLKNTSQQDLPLHKNIVSGIGGFASLFRFDFQKYKSPCLVSATDGVGTKLKLAVEFDSHESIAQDLVAMCVNDLICVGADPLFFLDYYATGKLEVEKAKRFLTGLRSACTQANCVLIGGETAEMPGVYAGGDFDCAGFAVGVVDEDKALGSHRVQEGDRVVAVNSSGFHSNGYSLLRKLFAQDLEQWQEELLTPTHLYVQLVQSLDLNQVHAISHITGGGIDNINRILPQNFGFDLQSWQWPKAFKEAQKRGDLSDSSMLKTFNCGIGMVFILPVHYFEKFCQKAEQLNFQTYDLGVVRKGKGVNY